MRTLVGGFGWTIYSGHYGSSLSMHIWLDEEEIQCGIDTDSSSRSRLWDLCIRSIQVGQRALYGLSKITCLGPVWAVAAEHIISIMEVYIQTISLRLFPHPHGCNTASILLVRTLCMAIGSEVRLAFKQKQIAEDCPSSASA
jgi:hypothetical protein